MIFNCTSCCKAISSEAEICPYCMIALDRQVKALIPPEFNPEKAIKPFQLFAKKKLSRMNRKVTHASRALPETITHIVNSVRTTKPHHT